MGFINKKLLLLCLLGAAGLNATLRTDCIDIAWNALVHQAALRFCNLILKNKNFERPVPSGIRTGCFIDRKGRQLVSAAVHLGADIAAGKLIGEFLPLISSYFIPRLLLNIPVPKVRWAQLPQDLVIETLLKHLGATVVSIGISRCISYAIMPCLHYIYDRIWRRPPPGGAAAAVLHVGGPDGGPGGPDGGAGAIGPNVPGNGPDNGGAGLGGVVHAVVELPNRVYLNQQNQQFEEIVFEELPPEFRFPDILRQQMDELNARRHAQPHVVDDGQLIYAGEAHPQVPIVPVLAAPQHIDMELVSADRAQAIMNAHEVCSICNEEMASNARGGIVAPFGCTAGQEHAFCRDCAEGWMQSCRVVHHRISCPVCRHEVDV